MIFCFFRFSDLTGSDYSEGAIELARNLAARDGFTAISFLVSILYSSEVSPSAFYDQSNFP